MCAFCVQFEVASRLADRLGALEARVKQSETQLDRAGRSQADELKRSETKLSKRITSAQSSLDQELQLLKQDYHKGGLFLPVTFCHQWINTHTHTYLSVYVKQIMHVKKYLEEGKREKKSVFLWS